ncbi:MAG: AMP-binding protein [Ilumatobacter sp.]
MTRSAARPSEIATLADLVASARLSSGGDIDPSAPALTDGRDELDWAGYVDGVSRVAGALVDAGLEPGDRVVVRMLKSVRSFVAVHGVLRAGGVVTPVDPLAPAGHAIAVAADAGASIGLCDPRSGAGLAAPDGPLAHILDPAVILASDVPPTAVDVAVGPDDVAYIIYTSGSTGRPKGIVHTHASALAYATAAADEYQLGSADRFANIAPLQFDQSTFELYTAALLGACVVVVPDAMLRFPASLSKLIADQRVSVWYSVPFVLEQMVARGAPEERDFSALRWILFGGESFAADRLAALRAHTPNATISNVYGPAEVNQCTRHDIVPGAPLDPDIPIGAAWSVATCRLVEPDDVETTIDGPGVGRLLVHTATAMSGYWRRPDLTDSAFHDLDGGRWYDTGDLVRRRDDELLVFVGRVDNQVKVRGQRIELEAVDAALNDLPGVDAAIAVVLRGADSTEMDRLVALVVTSSQTDGVRAELATRLAPQMVPDEVIAVSDLPRTSSGKIDRPASQQLVSGR